MTICRHICARLPHNGLSRHAPTLARRLQLRWSPGVKSSGGHFYFVAHTDDLLRSHDELRAALIIAGKRVLKLQFGRRNDDPVLVHLRQVMREARAVRGRFKAVRRMELPLG